MLHSAGVQEQLLPGTNNNLFPHILPCQCQHILMISTQKFSSSRVTLIQPFTLIVKCDIPQSFLGPRRLHEASTHPDAVTVQIVSRSTHAVLGMILRLSGNCANAIVFRELLSVGESKQAQFVNIQPHALCQASDGMFSQRCWTFDRTFEHKESCTPGMRFFIVTISATVRSCPGHWTSLQMLLGLPYLQVHALVTIISAAAAYADAALLQGPCQGLNGGWASL